MIRRDVLSVANFASPGPALRPTGFGEAFEESYRRMLAESNAVYLRNRKQEDLDRIESEFTRAVGPVPEVPALTDSFVDDQGQVKALTRENWLFYQISKLPPDKQGQVSTREAHEARLIEARNQVLEETQARLAQTTGPGVAGELVGGMAGALSDPFVAATLPFGAGGAGLTAGRAIARVATREAFLSAAGDIPAQFIMAEQEERAGRVHTLEKAVRNVALAALGGFTFGGLMEGGFRIGQRVFNNARARNLERDIARLRDIEGEAELIARSMPGVDLSVGVQRRVAAQHLDEALVAVKRNDVPEFRRQVAYSQRALGDTPEGFAERVRAMVDEPEVRKAIVEAEAAGQTAKRQADEAGEALATREGVDPDPSPPLRREATPGQVVKEVYAAQKATPKRVAALNERLPAGSRIVRNRQSPSGYAVRVAGKAESPSTPIKDIHKPRSVAHALRTSEAFGEVPEANLHAEKAASRGARDAEAARYQDVEPEVREEAAAQQVDQYYGEGGRVTVDEEGGTKSLAEIREAQELEATMVDEFEACVRG